jgi:hypothetical protein
LCQIAEHRLGSSLTSQGVEQFLDDPTSLAESVEAFFRWRPQSHDPGGEMVLEAAVNGRARAILTFNRRTHLGGSAPFDKVAFFDNGAGFDSAQPVVRTRNDRGMPVDLRHCLRNARSAIEHYLNRPDMR